MAPRRFFGSLAKRESALVLAEQPSTPVVSSDPLVTVAEAAAHLHLTSADALYHLIYRHPEFPVRRLGRALRFDRSELDAWSRRHRPSMKSGLVIVRGA